MRYYNYKSQKQLQSSDFLYYRIFIVNRLIAHLFSYEAC